MDRRKFIVLAGGTVAVAGCLGDTADDDDDDGDDGSAGSGDDGTGNGGSNGDTEEMVDTLIEALEEEFDLVPDDGDHGWYVESGTIHAKYFERDGMEADIDVIGSIYAVAVEAGFDLDAHLTAMDRSDESHLYEYEIELDWAEAYNAGDMSEDSYLEAIRETA